MKRRKGQRLWFRAKEYGWGWYPVSWQGWMVTTVFAIVYMVSIIGFLGWIGVAKQSAGLNDRSLMLGIAEFLIWIVVLTAALFRICSRRGESARWRWGKSGK